MRRHLLQRLEEWKLRFGTGDDRALERLLEQAARRRFADAGELIRLHEALLFFSAYPRSARIARLARQGLALFAARLDALGAGGAGFGEFERPEVSGIAGSSFSAVFSYEVAARLAALAPRNIDIDWEGYDTDRLAPVLRRALPLVDEDWPVEAHVPFFEWIRAAKPPGVTDLVWLLERLAALDAGARERADLYDSLRLYLRWNLADTGATRTRLRLAVRKRFYHTAPLLSRRDATLDDRAPIPVRRLSEAEARRVLDAILLTSAVRYRELYGFSHPDAGRVFHASLGRGVDVYFLGVPPEWRLPLRAYHAGMFFKNGVPAGYIETLSFLEHAEVGFNLYYTFREGETAWLYVALLRLLRQMLGVTCFSVDPYQLGHENPEGIESGAFWFYRKLGFRPAQPSIVNLVEHEERRMRRDPAYRSSPAVLRRLAAGHVLLDAAGTEQGSWDRFHIRNLTLAVQRDIAARFHGNREAAEREAQERITRVTGVSLPQTPLALVLNLIADLELWSDAGRNALAGILRAKHGPDESDFLRRMRRHEHLRTELLRLGSA